MMVLLCFRLQPNDSGYGQGMASALIGYKVESSRCKDFDRIKSNCAYFSKILETDGGGKIEYGLKREALSVPGTSYWIRVSAQNMLGFGSTGCSIVQDYKVLPIVISPATFPVWVAFGFDCFGKVFTHVWIDDDAFPSQSFIVKTWGLPIAQNDLVCQIIMENGTQASIDALRLETDDIERTTTLELFPPEIACTRCQVAVRCASGGKNFEFPLVYFTYPTPSVEFIFPRDGPKDRATWVTISVIEYSGPKTKFGARMRDNLIDAYDDQIDLQIIGSCDSINLTFPLTYDLKLSNDMRMSGGEVRFDLAVEMPSSPCAGGFVELRLQFASNGSAARYCPSTSLETYFEYVGATFCSLDPEAAMVGPGTGGTTITAVICNVELHCLLGLDSESDPGSGSGYIHSMLFNSISASLSGNISGNDWHIICDIVNIEYDPNDKQMVLIIKIPEIISSRAGMLRLKIALFCETLAMDWEYIRCPTPYIDETSIHIVDAMATTHDCMPYGSEDTMLIFTVSGMSPLCGFEFTSFQLVGTGVEATVDSYQVGDSLHIQAKLGQISEGEYTWTLRGYHQTAQFSWMVQDAVTENKVTAGIQYRIYSGYSNQYTGCSDSDCGVLEASGQGSVATVSANKHYLLVLKSDGYYNGYFTVYVGEDGASETFNMVEQMKENQDRVVLSWGHNEDLDLWVYSASDRTQSVGWKTNKSGLIAGGVVTLDVDNWDGLDGPETTQFMDLTSGEVEIWINQYDATFTRNQVEQHPATVDIYCYECVDDQGQVKAGFVRSVTQTPNDVPSDGRNWWKVGSFMAQPGSHRVKWTTCRTDCYLKRAQADLSSQLRRADVSPKYQKGEKPVRAMDEHAPNAGESLTLKDRVVTGRSRRSASSEYEIQGSIQVCVRDMSKPHLVTFAPVCGPTRAGTVVLVGITGASSLQNNACVNLDDQVSDILIGMVPAAEWGNLQSDHYLRILSETSQMSFVSDALAAEYANVVSETLSAAYAAGSVNSGIIAVLKLPMVENSEVSLKIADCAGQAGDGAVNFDFQISELNATNPIQVIARTMSSGALPSSDIQGGVLLVLELYKFPVVFDLNDALFTISFGETLARKLRLARSDCEITIVHVEVPPGDPGKVDCLVKFETYQGSFEFIYVNDVVPYVDFFLPFQIYADGGHEIIASVWGLPHGCSLSDMQLSVEIVDQNLKSETVGEYKIRYKGEGNFELTFNSSNGAIGMASVTISVCGKLSRPFEVQYIKVPTTAPEISISPTSGFCMGRETINVILTGMRKTDQRDIHILFGDVELPSVDSSIRMTSSMSMTTLAFDIPVLAQSGNIVVQVWSKAYPSLKAIAVFDCLEYPSFTWTSSSQFYGCSGPLATRVLLTFENIGDDINVPCSSQTGDVNWQIETVAPVNILWLAQDMLTQTKLQCVTHEIYSGYSNQYTGCSDSDCGVLEASGQGSVATVSANKHYLLVLKSDGYYNGYFTVYVGEDGASETFNMVEQMKENQDRVVLSWGHNEDLDLWVYSASDRTQSVGWKTNKSGLIAGGVVTLDVDNWDGLDGPETTQFMDLTSGEVEIWINQYDATFTRNQVEQHPATVDIYCYECVDDQGQVKAGFVRSVTQTPNDVPSDGRNWWKVGSFMAQSGSHRVKWTTCRTDCYLKRAQADLSSQLRRADVSPKYQKGEKPVRARAEPPVLKDLQVPVNLRQAEGTCTLARGAHELFVKISSADFGVFDIRISSLIAFDFEFVDCEAGSPRIRSFEPYSEYAYGKTQMTVLVSQMPSNSGCEVWFGSYIAGATILRSCDSEDASVVVQIPSIVSPVLRFPLSMTPKLVCSNSSADFPSAFTYLEPPSPVCEQMIPSSASIKTQTQIRLALRNFPGFNNLLKVTAKFEWSEGSDSSSTVVGYKQLDRSLPLSKMQDFELDVLSPIGSRVQVGMGSLRVFNSDFPSMSAVCRGFVFVDPLEPRISMISGPDTSGVKSLHIPMTKSSDVKLEIENAPTASPTSSVSLEIDCSRINIALAAHSEERRSWQVWFSTNPSSTASHVYGLVVFGSIKQTCSSQCCKDYSCKGIFGDVKTACFSLQYFDDRRPTVSSISDSSGPDIGGQTLRLSISRLPQVTQRDFVSVMCDENERVLGDVAILSSNDDVTDAVVITSAIDLRGATKKQMNCRLEHSARPDLAVTFMYVYHATKARVVSFSPKSGCSSDHHEAFVNINYFPYPSQAQVRVGGAILSSVRLWEISTRENSFISFTVPSMPPGHHEVTIAPTTCSNPCNSVIRFSFLSLDCSQPRIVGESSIRGPICKEHLPEIAVANFPENPTTVLVYVFNSEHQQVNNVFDLLNNSGGSSVVVGSGDADGNTKRLVIPMEKLSMAKEGRYVVNISISDRGTRKNISFYFEAYNCHSPRIVEFSPQQISASAHSCGKQLRLKSTVSVIVANIRDVGVQGMRSLVGRSAQRAEVVSVRDLVKCGRDAVDCNRTQIVLAFPPSDSAGIYTVELFVGQVLPLKFEIEYALPCDWDMYCQSMSMILDHKTLQDSPVAGCHPNYCIDSDLVSHPKIISVTPSEGLTLGGTNVTIQIQNFPVFSAADVVVMGSSGVSRVFVPVALLAQESGSNVMNSKGVIIIRTPAVPHGTTSMTFYIETRLCSISISVPFDFDYLPVISGPATVVDFQPKRIYTCQNLELIVVLQNFPRLPHPFDRSMIRVQVGEDSNFPVDQIISSDRFGTRITVKSPGPWQPGTVNVKIYSRQSGESNAAYVAVTINPLPEPAVSSVYPAKGNAEEENQIQVTVAHVSLSSHIGLFSAKMIMKSPEDLSTTNYSLEVAGLRNITKPSCFCSYCSLFELLLKSHPLSAKHQSWGGLATISINSAVSFTYSFQAAGSPSIDLIEPRSQPLCAQGAEPFKFFLRNFPSKQCKSAAACKVEAENGGLQIIFGDSVGRVNKLQDINGLLLIEVLAPTSGVAGISDGSISAQDFDGKRKSLLFSVSFDLPEATVVPMNGPVAGGSLVTMKAFGWGATVLSISGPEDLTVNFGKTRAAIVAVLESVTQSDKSFIRVVVRTPPALAAGLLVGSISNTDKTKISPFVFEYFNAPTVVSLRPNKATLLGETQSADGKSIELEIKNFPAVLSESEVEITFGQTVCIDLKCGITRFETLTDRVRLTIRVPSSSVEGDVILSVKHVGIVPRVQNTCEIDPESPVKTEMKISVGFNYFALLPAVLTTAWCNVCNEGRMCVVMGRCGDGKLPLENRAHMSGSGTLTVVVKDMCFPDFDPADGKISAAEVSRVSLKVGNQYSSFKKVAYQEQSLMALEFSVPALSIPDTVAAVLTVRLKSRILPCSVPFTLVQFDGTQEVECIGICEACSSGGGVARLRLSNVPISTASIVEQVSVKFGAVDATSLTLIEGTGDEAQLEVEIPPYDCPMCTFGLGKRLVSLMVVPKIGLNAPISTSFTYWSPPRILSATMSRSATNIQVIFDQPTNRAGMSASDWNCSHVLHDSCIGLLGHEPKCIWSVDDVLDIYLGVEATVVPGQGPGVLVATGVLQSKSGLCSHSPSAEILPPARLAKPIISLLGRGTIDPCSDLQVSAHYFSSRPLVFSWGCSNDEVFDQALRTFTGDTLTLPSGTKEMKLFDKEYHITATATDFLGAKSDTRIFKVFKKSSPSPQVVFDPPSLSVFRGDEVLVSAVASFSACPLPREKMTFTWRQVNGPVIPEEYLGEGSQLGFPGGLLTPGSTYTFAVRVTMGGDVSKTSESTYRIEVLRRPLLARIRGGNSIRIPVSRSLSLDASDSRDPDLDEDVDQELMFSWSCTVAVGDFSMPCLDVAGNAISLGTSHVIIVDGNTLAPTVDAPYIFTVEVFKSPRVPQAYSMPVYLDKENIPYVFISFERGVMQPNGAFKINVNDQLVLEGGCETEQASYELLWTLDPLPQTSSALEILGEYKQILSVMPSSGLFVPGNQYTSVLTCVDASGASSHSELSLIINSPPAGPPCAVCKLGEADGMCTKTGAPIHDIFRYSCARWSDEDLPLQFQFGYSVQVNGQYQGVNFDWGAASQLDLSFPSGTLDLAACVRDILGAETEKMYDRVVIFSPVPLFIQVHDLLEPSGSGGGGGSGGLIELEGATFAVYRNCSSLEECKRSLARTPESLKCGDLYFGDEVGAENVAFSQPGAYLVVIKAPGYFAVVVEIDAVKLPIHISLPMLKHLPSGQDRVVLSWDHSGDLDLWIDAMWGSGDWSYIGHLQKNAGDSDQSITLDLDSRDGALGPETTRLEGISSGGSYEVWINVYEWAESQDKFNKESISSNPATVDIFCSKCYDETGVEVAGMVTSVTQSADKLDGTGAAWWKVGEFTDSGDLTRPVLRKWKTCTSECFQDVRMVRVSVQTFKLVDLDEQLAIGASYTIYSNFPKAYPGCEKVLEGGCGVSEASGFISDSVVSDVKVPADREYLIVVTLHGYETIYQRVYIEGAGFRGGHITTLQTLKPGQNQIILNWAHDGDLDLGVMSYLEPVGLGNASFVNYKNPIYSENGNIELLLDSEKGHEGPETTILKDLSAGDYEVWIHWNDTLNYFTKVFVEFKPATVNVFCSGCFDEADRYLTGLVASITQNSEDLPVQGASWWKVGEFVRTRYKLQWRTCKSNCYFNARMVKLALVVDDMLSDRQELRNTAIQVYSGYPADYDNCEHRSACGTFVTTSNSSSVVSVPADGNYLVIATKSNYYSSYFTGYVGDTGSSGHLRMVPMLAFGQNRVVLSWDHSGDLDLWIDAMWGSGDWSYIGHLQKNAGDSDQSITLDLDSRAGALGPETTRLEGISSGGSYEVWINVYEWAESQDKFNKESISSNPATVDIFCYSCLDDLGYARTGRVQTIIQAPSDIPPQGVTWWKVGEFKSVSGSTRLRWQTCMRDCYTSVRMVHFSVKGLELLDEIDVGERLEAPGAAYQVYSGYPESYLDCELRGSCGTLVGQGLVGTVTDVATDRDYLTVILLEGYYVGYFTSHVSLLGGKGYSNMVKTVGNDQSRVVLRWDHEEDLDLWVDATWGSMPESPFNFVYYEETSASFEFSSINLQGDSLKGIADGPETVVFEGLTDGRFEIWVNYKSKFTGEEGGLVDSTPATVDIFCDLCNNDEGKPTVGRVATVTQKLPDGDAAWWKAGEFVAVPFGTVKLGWKTCKTDCYRGTTRMFAGAQNLIVHALNMLDGSELPQKRVRVFEDYGSQDTYTGCDPTATAGDQRCGTLTAEGSNAVLVPPNMEYLVVVSVDGYYYSYMLVYVRNERKKVNVTMVGKLATKQDRVVVQWPHAGDLDLWVKATWGPAAAPRSEDLISYDEMSSNDGDSSIILDVDNINGFEGPETTRFENLLEGIFEVWVNIYENPPEYPGAEADAMYTVGLLTSAPARMDIFCSSCLLDSGVERVERAGFVTSVTQKPADLPGTMFAWWKVGVFTKQLLTSRLIWQTCASDCYSEQGPQSTQRRSLYWISQMLSGLSQQRKTKHSIPRKSKQDQLGTERSQPSSQNISIPVIMNQTLARPKKSHKMALMNHSQVSSTKISRYVERSPISLKKPAIAVATDALTSEHLGYPDHDSSSTAFQANHFPKQSPHKNSSIPALALRSKTKLHKATAHSLRKDLTSMRKLLQFEELNTWADAERLLQESLDRQDFFAINMMSSALSQEIDSRLENGMVDSGGAAEQKAYILKTLTEGLDKAFKTEGYICEVLSVSQTISSNPEVLMPQTVQVLSDIVRTVLSVGNIHLLQTECAESALGISSKGLDALWHNRPCNSASGPDESATSAKTCVNDLERNMKLLARKQIPALISGQTRELMGGNWSSQLTKQRIGDILGRSVSLIAAAGGQTGITVSYKLPASILRDVAELGGLNEFSVQFETFHNAPHVDGIQPVSPLVSITISDDDGQEIPVSGLTSNVEIVIPIVNQARCEHTKYPTLVCMYWDPVKGTYRSDGCFVKGIRAGSVTCSCNHLTSIVLVPGELPPTTTPRPSPQTTSKAIKITTTTPVWATSSALSSATTPAPSAASTPPTMHPPTPQPTQAPQATPKPIAGPEIAIGIDANTYRWVTNQAGIYSGYFEIYVATSPNKFLNITTTGITPTCDSRVVGSSSPLVDNREVSTMAPRGMVKVIQVNKDRNKKVVSAVMATFCESGAASEISSHNFELGPGHMVQVTMTISGPISASNMNDKVKNDLLKALANRLVIAIDQMEILSIQDARRRLLAVQLTLALVANSATQAEEIKNSIASSDIGALLASLGFSNIVVSDVQIEVKAPPTASGTPMSTTPEPKPKTASNVPVIVSAVVGSTLFLGITAAVLYFVLSRRRAKQLLADKLALAESIEEKISELPPPNTETENTEIETETEEITDFNRDIQLIENYGPELLRSVKGTRNKNMAPMPMEASAGAVHPNAFQPVIDSEDVEMRSDPCVCSVC
jgi:hypothetical protein